MHIDEALKLAEEMYKDKRFLNHELYQWEEDAVALVSSDVFTAAQVAAILGMSKSYVARRITKLLGPTTQRSHGGVAGNFNPESLTLIQYVRASWLSHESRRKIDSATRAYIRDLIEAGNGLSLLSHLTGIPRPTLVKIKSEEEEN